LERLTKQHPDNAEAYIHLAEAYRATGKKDKALEALEACKRIVNESPEAVQQVQQIINQIKNS
jgi:cytochrome c-type biogenesis protein CcmH/NrfG